VVSRMQEFYVSTFKLCALIDTLKNISDRVFLSNLVTLQMAEPVSQPFLSAGQRDKSCH